MAEAPWAAAVGNGLEARLGLSHGQPASKATASP
jgi:hypothetical protein